MSPMKNDFYPRETLRNQLANLGVPRDAHNSATLAGMLPVHPNGSRIEGVDADSLAEALIYLIGKEIIRVPCRLDALVDFDWGTHICQFYRSEDDLLEFLVSYFKQGLENGDYCVWVATPPLTSQRGREALSRALPTFEEYERALEFVDHADWYLDDSGQMKPIGVILQNWARKAHEVVAQGYQGLRCSGDTRCWIEKKDWNGFVQYECQVNAVIDGVRMKAACTHPLTACASRQMSDVLERHQDVFVKRDAWWHRIATADANQAKAVLLALQGSKS
jgi:hypothetical protein